MKISFSKRILVIGSIFCGLISPVKAEDNLNGADINYGFNARDQYWAANGVGILICINNERNYGWDKKQILEVASIAMKKANENTYLLKNELVYEVGEKIGKLLGDNCKKDLGSEFSKEQIALFVKDKSSVEKYEKLQGKKFTAEEKVAYSSFKKGCHRLGNLGKDLDKCINKAETVFFSQRFDDQLKDKSTGMYTHDFEQAFVTCSNSNENKIKKVLNFYGYKNLADCVQTNFDANKNCNYLRKFIIPGETKGISELYSCMGNYKDKHLTKLSNERRKIHFDEINRNENLVLFEKKFCWSDDSCEEIYYDKNSFRVTSDGVTFFDKRRLNLTENYHPTYDEKSILGIDCSTKEFVEKRGRKNILFPKDATREQKEMYAVKRFKKEYQLACKGGKYPTINKSSQEMFVTQKDNMFSEEMNQKLFESTKEGMKKIDKSSKKEEQKSDNDAHQICLKAADYKGCMKYQNR